MSPAIPSTIKAAQVEEFGSTQYSFNDIDVPKPSDYEYLIKVGAAGYCHTDSMVAHGAYESIGSKCPITPVGTIVAMGDKATEFGKQKVGDRVGSYALKGPCGKCPDCTVFEDPTYCTDAQGFVGLTLHGGFAEYCLIDARATASLPSTMSFQQAAPLMCAGVTIYKAIRRAEQFGLKAGGTIGFSGIGGLGQLGVQFAKVMGYKVVGFDNRPEPVELGKGLKYPPDRCLNSEIISAEETAPLVQELDPKKAFAGIDACILLADPQESFDYATKLLVRHGILVLISQPDAGIKLNFMDLVFKDVRLVSGLLGTAQELQETVDLCAKHGIESVLTTYKLTDINELVESTHDADRKGKNVVILE